MILIAAEVATTALPVLLTKTSVLPPVWIQATLSAFTLGFVLASWVA